MIMMAVIQSSDGKHRIVNLIILEQYIPYFVHINNQIESSEKVFAVGDQVLGTPKLVSVQGQKIVLYV